MGKTDAGSSARFWQSSLESLRAELRAEGAGLDEAEAARRYAVYGPNVLRPHRERALALQFLSRFGNPLIILLLAAATLSAFTGDVPSFVIIAIVVVLSVTLDFVQEYRAGQAAERLKQSVALRAAVVEKIDFVREVQPLLAENCVKCHGPEKQKAGLRLDLKTAAMKGGDDGKVIEPAKID